LADALSGSGPAWPDQREEVTALRVELTECGTALEHLTASAKQLEQRQRKALAALTSDAVTIPESVRQVPVAGSVRLTEPLLLTEEQAAERLLMHPRTLRKLRQLGRFATWR
jgi:hypothetical protein